MSGTTSFPVTALLIKNDSLAENEIGGVATLISELGVPVTIDTSFIEDHGLIRIRGCATKGYVEYRNGSLVLYIHNGATTIISLIQKMPDNM